MPIQGAVSQLSVTFKMMYVSNLLSKTFWYKLALASLFLVIGACKEQGNNETDNGSGSLVGNNGGSGGVNNAPTIVIDSPANGSEFLSSESISLFGSSSDDEDGDLSASIAWRSSLDGNLGSGASLSVSLSEGSHTITAAIADSGNQSRETSVNITVVAPEPQNTAPQISINSPSNNALFEQGDVITFAASAFDNEDGDLSADVQWYSSIDGALGHGASVQSSLGVGSHTVTATVIDSGNLSSSRSILINVNPATPDNRAPQVTIQSPTNGSSFQDDETVQLAGTASDNEDGTLSHNIVWNSSIDGVLGTGASLQVMLSEGDHTLTASVTDSGNLSSSNSVIVSVTAAPPVNTAPQLTISSPSNGGNYDDQQSVSLSATATDAEDGNISQSIVWSSSIDGQLGSGSNLSVNLSAGSHNLTAVVSDSGGLSAQASVSIQVIHINQAPEINITSPANGSSVNDDETVTFTAAASDAEDGDLSQSIIWTSSIDGQLGSGSNLVVSLTEGTHQITASVTDADNATSENSISIIVNHVNVAPSVSILSPTNGTNVNENETVTLSGEASDVEDGDLSGDILWVSDLDGVLGTGASLDAQLSSGVHMITAIVTDAGNLTDEQTISLTVNQVSGTATVTWVAPSEYTDNTALTDLAGFKIYYGIAQNDLTESVTIDDPAATSWVIENLNGNSTYFFAVTAFNASGVESEYSNIASKTFN